MSSSNGTPPDASGLPRGDFDAEKLLKLVEFAIELGGERVGRAEQAVADAKAVLAKRRAEVARLERARLALRPGSRRPGEPGAGIGARVGVFLLECFTTRYRQSGDPAFTTALAFLAAKSWPRTTVESGLRRLVADGLIRRTGLGKYELTELGQRQPPAASVPLLPRRRPETEEVTR